MRIFTVALATIVLIGCGTTTTLAPQAEAIKVTRNPADVANCKVLGTVEAHPPYMVRNDDIRQMKNAALPLGADTILVTRRVGDSQGVAYRCNAAP